MLLIDDLTVRYRTPGGEIEALSSISLKARKGSTLALVGESGSGKSTVALAAMGLLPQEATIPSGPTPFVTQLSSAFSVSKLFGATPPPQCPIPGTMKRRTLSCVGP